MNKDKIDIEVIGGMCTIIFSPAVSCGADDDGQPGVGFELCSEVPALEYNGKYFSGTGVIGRKDAARLRDMLEIFLKNHAAGVNHP